RTRHGWRTARPLDRAPGIDETLDVLERHAAAIARRVEQPQENVGRGQRIASGAVPRADVDAVVVRNRIEVSPAQARHEATCHAHRTEAAAGERSARHAL